MNSFLTQWKIKCTAVGLVWTFAAFAFAPNCFGQRPPLRRHTANERADLSLVDANQTLQATTQVAVVVKNRRRIIRVNGIPEHAVGQFPNRGNPHAILERWAAYEMPLHPRVNDEVTPVELGWNFGVAINGVVFDPGAAEFYLGDAHNGWQYEALGGAVPLGLDAHLGHVQPDGKYHYHGIPTGLLESVNFDRAQHSPMVGWAADGFPIYALTGFSDPRDPNSEIVELKPGYRLKVGDRPGGANGDRRDPGGTYDGTFVNDYEFVPGSGDLDECNGRYCITPDFPDGTYAYFLTEHWPSIPRFWRGTPDKSFHSRPGPPAPRPGR